jgi:hypothetical protein
MKSKKSQITVFMIIGIVVVVIVAMIYGINRRSQTQTAEEAIIATREAQFDVQPITTYVESCLERYAKEGLVLIGKQGGRLLKDQGGVTHSYRGIDVEGYKVPFAIFPPNPLTIIEYPWATFPYDDQGNEIYTGNFGDNLLPALEKHAGTQSIQLQVESYVNNEMDNCNLDVFSDQFDITTGIPRLNTTIARGNVIFKLTYPLEVEDFTSGSKTTVDEFYANARIRLGKIYEFARSLTENDVNNVKFALSGGLDGMTVEVEKKPEGDIITISDPQSALIGESYLFKFARKNRVPALHWINENEIPNFLPGDAVYPENITSQPRAYDPDEESPNIVFRPVSGFLAGTVPVITSQAPATIASCPAEVHVCASDGQSEDCQEIRVC